MFMVLEDIELEVLKRKMKFFKGRPYSWNTYIKTYPENFVPYQEASDIIIDVFDFGNNDLKVNNIGIKMNNTEIINE